MFSGARDLLGHVSLYVGLQKLIGADKLRYRCIDTLALSDGDVVIDVGCGPAYYFDRLPRVKYYGFDTSEVYIQHATARYGAYGTFRSKVFDEADLASMPRANAILLFGLLHHLSDADSVKLLRLLARALAPGGQVVALDTVFDPSQGRVSRWMSEHDRGQFVRSGSEFTHLATMAFRDIEAEILSGLTRVPASYWLMRMRIPIEGSPRGCDESP